MPYALSIQGDGLVPGARYISTPGMATSGEVVLADTDYSGKETYVWDASTGTLRLKTQTEVVARERIETLRVMDGSLRVAIEEVMPLYKAVALLADKSNDPALAGLKGLAAKYDRAVAAADRATTPEQLHAINWRDA